MSATDLEALLARKATIMQTLKYMDLGQIGGNPNIPAGIDHVAWRKSLYEELKDINEQIPIAEGPWEVKS